MIHTSVIGHHIRQRRSEIGISLRELARRTGLTPAFISQVERGKTSPSLDSLRRIAEALEVSILHFLVEEVPGEPSAPSLLRSSGDSNGAERHMPVVRSTDRPRFILPHSGVAYELLSPDLSRKMEAICGRISPNSGNVARRLRQPTEEFIYVLSGALLVGLDSEEHILNPGDSIYIDGASLRRLSCASPSEDAVWISVLTPAVF